MKRTKTLLAVAVLIVMASCGKKVEVSLSKSSIDFRPEGGDIEVALTSNGDWTATSSVEWIAVSPASGKGDATLEKKFEKAEKGTKNIYTELSKYLSPVLNISTYNCDA